MPTIALIEMDVGGVRLVVTLYAVVDVVLVEVVVVVVVVSVVVTRVRRVGV